jgi:HAE1 family hydrophobic/amphiphilic exporter-1
VRDEINEHQKALAGDQVKPQVNLVASYNNTGLAGDLLRFPNPIATVTEAQVKRLNELSAIAGLAPLPTVTFGGIPSSLVGGYATSITNLFSGSYQTVSAGLQIDWNIRNRTAEANLVQTAIAERRLKLQRQLVTQGIEAEVRNALQGVETARQKMQASRAAERAAQEKLDSEVRLFQTGESTNFLVLVRQNEVLDARRRAVQAALLNNKAVAILARATGATLEANRITLK